MPISPTSLGRNQGVGRVENAVDNVERERRLAVLALLVLMLVVALGAGGAALTGFTWI